MTQTPAPPAPPIAPQDPGPLGWPWWAWSLAAAVGSAALDLRAHPALVRQSLGDTDDATRLIEVRALMGGASWFDMTLPQFGGAHPLVSHWSRLVDLPLAAILWALELFMPAADAVIALRVVWPKLLLFLLLLVLTHIAQRRGGRVAAVLTVLLTLASSSAMMQFTIGRIDHHNLQILAVVSGVVWLASSFQTPRAGWFAGAALGLGAAVGYEGLPLTTATLGLASVLALYTGRGGPGVARAAGGFALVLASAFAVTVAPAAWTDVRCDALSANLVLLAAVVCPSLAFVLTRMGGAGRLTRVAVLGGALALGLAAYLAVEPACLGGPFGQVDPAVKPIWMDRVLETKSILALLALLPTAAAAYIAHIMLGAVTARWLVWQHRDDEAVVYAGSFAAAFVLGLLQLKLMPYPSVLAVLPIALTLAGLQGTPNLSAPLVRLAGFLLLNQTTLFMVLAMTPLGAPTTDFSKNREAMAKCTATSAAQMLATLPPGLVVADLTLTPYIAALTPLRVLAGPYHRIDAQILETDAILNGPADAAADKLRAADATYVVRCSGVISKTTPPGSLDAVLTAGATPPFLEPVPVGADAPLQVWRVVSAGSPDR